MLSFFKRVIWANRWQYFVIVVLAFAYSFGLSHLNPPLYRSEALLAFKNPPEKSSAATLDMIGHPLLLFLLKQPIEQQYQYDDLLYTNNLANRAIAGRMNQLYDPKEYHGLFDFYAKFLSRLGYQYDGDKDVITLSYTYKDRELAADFVQGFAKGLEDLMVEEGRLGYVTPALQARLEKARKESQDADAALQDIARKNNVPDLLATPVGWVKDWGVVRDESFKSDAKLAALRAAIGKIKENRAKRDLLVEPQGTPDSTMMKDVVLGLLRLRYAILEAGIALTSQSQTTTSPRLKAAAAELASLKAFLEKQYMQGYDVELTTLQMDLDAAMVQDAYYKSRVNSTWARLEQIPRIEAEIRPAIRRSNAAFATVALLERLSKFTSVGEAYGEHPLQVIDPGVPAAVRFEPGWNTLKYLLPTLLFLATLWFAFAALIIEQHASTSRSSNSPKEVSA